MRLKSENFTIYSITDALLIHSGSQCSFVLPMNLKRTNDHIVSAISPRERQQAVCRICAETDEKQSFSQYPNSTDLGISSVHLDDLTDATLMILEHPTITEAQFCRIMMFSPRKINSLLGGFDYFKSLVLTYKK